MRVDELSRNQFEELKQNYLMEYEDDCEDLMDWEIDETVRQFYEGTEFTIDDFSCTAGEYEREMSVEMTFDEDEIRALEKIFGYRVDDEEELTRALWNLLNDKMDFTEGNDYE